MSGSHRGGRPISPWWADAVIYEVYIRSFADSGTSGEHGVGDLRGVTSRIGHLADLGVDALWVTPFYPSPGLDHGYDITDHCDVDPTHGDLADFDAMVHAAHEHGLKVVVDIVPNHTSDQHPWFDAARTGHDPAARDRYIWRDPAPDGGPPNNWRSNFGGPAWTLDPDSGQYWLHLYLPEQPDLNWANPEVDIEFRRILDFWADRGVDGFRIDVAHSLLKHPGLPDNPALEPASNVLDLGRVASARELQRLYDVDQDEVLGIYRGWRTHLQQRRDGPHLLLGETVVDDRDRVVRYVRDDDGLHAAMWFDVQRQPFEAEALAHVLQAAEAAAPGRLSWFLSNHDRSRPTTRYGGGALGADRALAVAAVVLALPGPYLLYQGEELGCADGSVAPEAAADPIAARAGEHAVSRDRARTPMPWSAGPGGGFTRGTPWLPVSPRPPAGYAEEQYADVTSHYQRWRALLQANAAIRDRLPSSVTVDLPAAGLLRVHRGPLTALLNTGGDWMPLPMAGDRRGHPQRSAVRVWDSIGGAIADSTGGTDGTAGSASVSAGSMLAPSSASWWVEASHRREGL
ncbi:MAG TPA: alpha-amylase family glycosyl hydrolase [Jiangellaceae bacterium]|nr:alpha-amylase family glycosyl hydrolase [Jiangellaceae bacterium]